MAVTRRMQAVQTPIIPVVGQLIRENPGTISLGQGVAHYGPPQEAIDRIAHFLADASARARAVHIPHLRTGGDRRAGAGPASGHDLPGQRPRVHPDGRRCPNGRGTAGRTPQGITVPCRGESACPDGDGKCRIMRGSYVCPSCGTCGCQPMTRDEMLRRIRDHRADLERLGVRSLALFGSAARGDDGIASDVDLLVEFSQPVGLFRFLDLKDYLESLLGREVDLVTPDALKAQLRPRILAEAVRAL